MPDGSKFSCAACGREFRWKPELAGKRAKCKCGAAVQVPATDPARAKTAAAAPAEESFEDVYALAAAEAEQSAAANQRSAQTPPRRSITRPPPPRHARLWARPSPRPAR